MESETPDPESHKFSELVFLIDFGDYHICPNWLSGSPTTNNSIITYIVSI